MIEVDFHPSILIEYSISASNNNEFISILMILYLEFQSSFEDRQGTC